MSDVQGRWDYIVNAEHNAYLRGLKRAEEIAEQVSVTLFDAEMRAGGYGASTAAEYIRAEREKIEKGE